MKIGLLSNVNIESIGKRLSKNYDVFWPKGYGSVIEELINSKSDLWKNEVDNIFIYNDIWNLTSYGENIEAIEDWFDNFESSIHKDCIYFIFDADWMGGYITGYNGIQKSHMIEAYWNKKLDLLCKKKSNCFSFAFKSIIEYYGSKNIYSPKMWLLGKIPFSATGEKQIVKEIINMIKIQNVSPKKALVLDLDNTLWGGVIGEDGVSGIKLGRESGGAPYYFFQLAIKKIRKAGVLLCIVSKNNSTDVEEVFRKHPDMILKKEDFTVIKANWELKSKNIIEIAQQLNISTDSFVFIDDNPIERREVIMQIDGIAVPDFPLDVADLTDFADDIYKKYFAKLDVTVEDFKKAKNYADNFKRAEKRNKFNDFNDFLDSLKISVVRVENYPEYITRIHQLIYKTNQFNLTTKRCSLAEISEMIEDKNYLVYLFNVSDCYGDSGQTALVIFNKYRNNLDIFVMSCRIMGRKIENYIIDYVEKDLVSQGITEINANYKYTLKNKPVVNFYESLGYRCIKEMQDEKIYTIDLKEFHERDYRVLK